MSERIREHLDTFWELIDEILNVLLFMLIGMETLVMGFHRSLFFAGVLAIALALAARRSNVTAVVSALSRRRSFVPGTVTLPTWDGLRGGISIAMPIGLPATPDRETILAMTHFVVALSVIVQGLTIGRVVRAHSRSIPGNIAAQ